LYKQILFICPNWHDAIYRQGVCLVKMGFAEQAMGFFADLIAKDPNMFNRALIDPELERGHIHLMSAFHGVWVATQAHAEEEKKKIEDLQLDVGMWFTEDHAFTEKMAIQISQLTSQAEVKNFVAFQRLINGRRDLAREFDVMVDVEGRLLRERFESYRDRLKNIQAEAAWFPFPKVLVEFNKEFNFCARNLNWAFRQHFQVADSFKKAQEVSESVHGKITLLETRLKTLKIVRDCTLFILLMGKTFFWLEVGGLIMSLLLLPLTIFYGQKMGYDWASGLVVRQKWEIQKGMVIILSILALALSSLRTALVFEGRRERLFQEARQKLGLNPAKPSPKARPSPKRRKK